MIDTSIPLSENDELKNQVVIKSDILPKELPILHLYESPIFPKMTTPILISDSLIIQFIIKVFQSDSKFIGLVLMKSDENNNQTYPHTPDDLYKVGVVGKILELNNPSNNEGPLQILVQCLERIEIKEYIIRKIPYRAKIKYLYDIRPESTEELRAFSVSIINTIKELVRLKPLFKAELSLLLEQMNIRDPGILSDFAASLTTAPKEELQKVLEISNVRLRIKKVLLLLKQELEIAKLQVKINKRIEDRLSAQQREFFLREQLKEIKKELGLTKEGPQAEFDKFNSRIQNLKLPAEASERIQDELEKIKILEPTSAEYQVSRTYLDWLTILPWNTFTKDNYNIKKATQILNTDHYGLNDVKERILELISVGILKGDLSGSIILLVGPPGVGKTSVGQSIARSLNRKFFRFSLGGMRDEAEIKGHRRTYVGALPGKFIQAIKTCKTSNPLIMLDEIDKIGASFQGDPASALLEVLDPEQNKDFLDHYLDVRFDLSKILFVCTANTTDTIPRPLLDRMEIIYLPGYILEEKIEIAQKFLIPKQLKNHGLKPKNIRLTLPIIKAIIENYAREAGVRSLENAIKKIFRKATKSIVTQKKAFPINKKLLSTYLGRPAFEEDTIIKKPKIGIATGLAYTAYGGATLFIESSASQTKNSGFKQTGQLGDIMIESSEIAYSFLRSFLSHHPVASQFFKDHFIHLHVPAGATPKDGPSAGITMACSLFSLIFNVPTIKNLAMTGELTLTGLVMPIGGVKEKMIAARRSKIKHLIFPYANQEDVQLLEKYLIKGLNISYVKTFQEVVTIVFPKISYQDIR